MIVGFAALCVFQLVGEILAYQIGGLIPGPVLGMALVAVALIIADRCHLVSTLRAQTISTSKTVLSNLGILFVPAGVGIVKHTDIIVTNGLPLVAVILVSTLATLAATVWSFLAAKRIFGNLSDE